MTTDKTEIHLANGRHEEVDGTPEEVAAQLRAGDGLVRLGEIFVNPAQVTHLTAAVGRGAAFG
jgi:hypothetical protein